MSQHDNRQTEYDSYPIELPIGWVREQCHDWIALCDDLGLDKDWMEECIASGGVTTQITIGEAKKHGLFCGGDKK